MLASPFDPYRTNIFIYPDPGLKMSYVYVINVYKINYILPLVLANKVKRNIN